MAGRKVDGGMDEDEQEEGEVSGGGESCPK